MVTLVFNGFHGRVGIPESAITGFCETEKNIMNHKVFIATGPDGVDGSENGWYVTNTFDEVKDIIDGVNN